MKFYQMNGYLHRIVQQQFKNIFLIYFQRFFVLNMIKLIVPKYSYKALQFFMLTAINQCQQEQAKPQQQIPCSLIQETTSEQSQINMDKRFSERVLIPRNQATSRGQLVWGLFFITFCLLMTRAKGECTSEIITQKINLSSYSYCDMMFNPCNNFSLYRCARYECFDKGKNCLKTIQSGTNTSASKTCYQQCCSNLGDTDNAGDQYSQKFCSTYTSNADSSNYSITTNSVGTYIMIAAFSTAFVICVIGICICKRRTRAQLEAARDNNFENGGIQGIPVIPTTVNLNSYDLDAQGPYFINTNDTCAICLDSKVNLRTHCNHFYHGNCLLIWLKKKPNNPCPLCMGVQYNPVKVYCVECHAGDKLVNIDATTRQSVVREYDIHKCSNCKNLNDGSFVMSELQSKNDQKPGEKNKQVKQVIQQPKNDKTNKSVDLNDSRSSGRSRRRHRKVQSIHKNEQDINQSSKKFKKAQNSINP